MIKSIYFYKKENGKIIQEKDQKKNNQAKKRLDNIKKEYFKNIPDFYLKNWSKVKLFNPAGNISKADSILINPDDGAFSLKNKLNELTGKEWTKFLSSWYIFNVLAKDLKEERQILNLFKLNPEEHPATYSPTMIANFIQFFTKKKEVVFDPFAGIGTTLVACDRTKRKGVGIELNKKYAKIATKRTKQKIIQGDSTTLKELFKINKIKKIDFCVTSPPYWDILNRSTKDFKGTRSNKKLDVNYSKNNQDIGNIKNYEIFIDKLANIFFDLKPFIKKNGYIIIIIKNIKKDGKNYPLAWDLAKKITEQYELKDEKIWCQDKVALAPYGYPYGYTTNIHHHYCLVFKNVD